VPLNDTLGSRTHVPAVASYTARVFTGLIQHLGAVRSAAETDVGRRLVIDALDWAHHAEQGESIAVSGCCLTVAERTGSALAFDVIPQTLARTTIGRLDHGDPVNLEHAATPSTLLGGHIVQGHVDGIGSARRLRDAAPGETRVRIEAERDIIDFLTPRGSVAVDGVSLTVADLGDSYFEIALIPVTLQRTTLSRIGDAPTAVNIETDCLARSVVQWLSRTQRVERSS